MSPVKNQPLPFPDPATFIERFPNYVYRRIGKPDQIQWREAALDMANDRAKLVKALQAVVNSADSSVSQAAYQHEKEACALLRELGEAS